MEIRDNIRLMLNEINVHIENEINMHIDIHTYLCCMLLMSIKPSGFVAQVGDIAYGPFVF